MPDDPDKPRGSPALEAGCDPDWLFWYHLTPRERWEESGILLGIYLSLGGSLEAEYDSDDDDPVLQSDEWKAAHAEWRKGVRRRRGGTSSP